MFDHVRKKIRQQVQREVEYRAITAGRQLRLAALQTLRKQGRSLPGQPPGRRSGTLAKSWRPTARIERNGSKYTYHVGITTDVFYARFLEEGTVKMAERPFLEKIQKQAWPKVVKTFTGRRYLR